MRNLDNIKVCVFMFGNDGVCIIPKPSVTDMRKLISIATNGASARNNDELSFADALDGEAFLIVADATYMSMMTHLSNMGYGKYLYRLRGISGATRCRETERIDGLMDNLVEMIKDIDMIDEKDLFIHSENRYRSAVAKFKTYLENDLYDTPMPSTKPGGLLH